MKRSRLRLLEILRYPCLVAVVVVGILAIIGSSGGGGGSDDNGGGGGPQTYSASGTYVYDSGTNTLTVTFTSSDFPDCGPDVGVEIITVDSVTETSMSWNSGDMILTRDSGTSGNIVGTWSHTDDSGNTYEVSINADGTMLVTGEIVDCGDDTPDPATYNATGSWSMSVVIDLGSINANIDCSPDPTGSETIVINQSGNNFTITNEDNQTFTGTVDGNVYTFSGTWQGSGNWTNTVSGTITLSSSNSFTGNAIISSVDGNDFCTYSMTLTGTKSVNGGSSLTITGESGNQVNLDGTWQSSCRANTEDGESENWVLNISGSTFSQSESLWFDSTTCFGPFDATVNFSGSVTLSSELTATMNSSNVTATRADISFSFYQATIVNSDIVSDLNANEECGFNDWAVGIPKNLLGTECGPDSVEKDVLYIDDTAVPHVLYGGEDEGPSDANGYPTTIDLDSAAERM